MDTTDREILATRLFDAPRELVFDAWMDARHLAAWWGPHGFTLTTRELDARPGGSWRFTMHGPDGDDYRNTIAYREINRPERLVYAHIAEDGGEPAEFAVTVTLVEQRGKTLLSVRMLFASATERNEVADGYGAVEGLHQTLDRLARHVTSPRRGSRRVLRGRVDDAAIDRHGGRFSDRWDRSRSSRD